MILQTIFRDFTEFKDLMTRLNLLEREVRYYKQGLDTVLSAKYNFNSIIEKNKSNKELKQLINNII